MNNKGFTLVELLATVLILSIITGIATISYTSYLKKTKSKAEEIFKENVSNYIDAFISANTSKLTDEELVGNNAYSQKYNNHSITFQDIINDNIIIPSNLKNSANKKECSKDTSIKVYRDNNFVYCYVVDLDCLDSSDKRLTNCSSYIKNKIGG